MLFVSSQPPAESASMTNFQNFAAAAFLLLLSPGPTNSVIAAGSAIEGWRRALSLIGAALLGYFCAIAALELFIAPFADAFRPVRFVLQLGCAFYLAFAAWKIWTSSQSGARAITWSRVFFVTVCNPKAAVFVFVILPPQSIGFAKLVYPYLSTLFTLATLACGIWLLVGASIHARVVRRGDVLIRRASSVVMAMFCLMLVLTLVGASR
jgi:threonine/homoserine/homoserine lactone efflux protein